MENEPKWQTRDEMPTPTNPLQRIYETLTSTSRDCSEDKMIAFLYGIIVGWEDAYPELQEKHNWSDDDVRLQKQWHEEYKKAWNLYMEALTKK